MNLMHSSLRAVLTLAIGGVVISPIIQAQTATT